ncbi:hypothetical protein B9Z19DRAFT_839984 [Tuber borchii]|uniref:Uncharacterized protein n=1 Tax=Tuber borchii TaxID=42251 RepID=A0A2T6ZUY6_TUBBO|nr:hypothetical protein B9Z19DRAFT_839984 [Tuber borchii]
MIMWVTDHFTRVEILHLVAIFYPGGALPSRRDGGRAYIGCVLEDCKIAGIYLGNSISCMHQLEGCIDLEHGGRLPGSEMLPSPMSIVLMQEQAVLPPELPSLPEPFPLPFGTQRATIKFLFSSLCDTPSQLKCNQMYKTIARHRCTTPQPLHLSSRPSHTRFYSRSECNIRPSSPHIWYSQESGCYCNPVTS